MNAELAQAGIIVPARRRDVIVQIEPRLISLEVGAAVYGLSADELAKMQDDDGFPMLRRGRRRLIPVRLADQWFEQQATAGAA